MKKHQTIIIGISVFVLALLSVMLFQRYWYPMEKAPEGMDPVETVAYFMEAKQDRDRAKGNGVLKDTYLRRATGPADWKYGEVLSMELLEQTERHAQVEVSFYLYKDGKDQPERQLWTFQLERETTGADWLIVTYGEG